MGDQRLSACESAIFLWGMPFLPPLAGIMASTECVPIIGLLLFISDVNKYRSKVLKRFWRELFQRVSLERMSINSAVLLPVAEVSAGYAVMLNVMDGREDLFPVEAFTCWMFCTLSGRYRPDCLFPMSILGTP